MLGLSPDRSSWIYNSENTCTSGRSGHPSLGKTPKFRPDWAGSELTSSDLPRWDSHPTGPLEFAEFIVGIGYRGSYSTASQSSKIPLSRMTAHACTPDTKPRTLNPRRFQNTLQERQHPDPRATVCNEKQSVTSSNQGRTWNPPPQTLNPKP